MSQCFIQMQLAKAFSRVCEVTLQWPMDEICADYEGLPYYCGWTESDLYRTLSYSSPYFIVLSRLL